MNRIERTIAALAPQYALRRAAARARLRFLEGSRSGVDWGRNTGRVEDALPARGVTRRRIINALSTNPYAVKAKATLLNNLVGYGITGTPVKGTPKKVTEHWNLFVANSDWTAALDFYGQQDLAIGTMLTDGDVFVVRRFDKDSFAEGRGVGTRLQLLDQDMLATTLAKGPIEYDERGRPAWYNFYRRRPGESGAWTSDIERIAADHVIHLFRREWIGQRRGRSLFEPVIKRYEDLDEYVEAEVVRKKIEACFVGFIQPSIEAGEADLGKVDGTESAGGYEIESFEPGMLERLNPGETVTFGDPKPTVGMSEFARVTLLGATAGVGVPYEHGTGDLSNVNYSSYKAGALEFQRFCGRLQWITIIPPGLDRIWRWFLQDGYESGVFARRDYRIDWTPAEFESLDRKKDAEGIVAELKAGLTSRRHIIGQRGFNYDEHIAQVAADNAAERKLGLQFEGSSSASPAGSNENAASA